MFNPKMLKSFGIVVYMSQLTQVSAVIREKVPLVVYISGLDAANLCYSDY